MPAHPTHRPAAARRRAAAPAGPAEPTAPAGVAQPAPAPASGATGRDRRPAPPASRRAVLGLAAGVGVAAATGCRLWDTDDPPPDPLAPLVADTAALAARYAQAMAAQPVLAPRLRPVREAHQAHAAALAAVVGVPVPTPAPNSDAAPTLAALRRAEEAARRTAHEACAAASGGRATLLGEITAARAAHVEALR